MAVLSRHFFVLFLKNSFLIKDIFRIAANVCERVISGESGRKFFGKNIFMVAKCFQRRYNIKIESTDERKKQNGKHVQRSHPL